MNVIITERTYIKLFYKDELYSALANELTGAEHWAWVALRLLCCESEYRPLIALTSTVGPTDEEYATLLGISLSVWKKTKSKLVNFGEIQVSRGNIINILRWSRFRSEYRKSEQYRKQHPSDAMITKSLHERLTEMIEAARKGESAKVKDDQTSIKNEVIEHLNKVCGKQFSSTSREAKTHISARVNEGATLENFLYVINNKAHEWLETTMERYLRPSTLFNCQKFWGYVNEPEHQKTKPIGEAGRGKSQTDAYWKEWFRIDKLLHDKYRKKLDKAKEERNQEVYDDIENTIAVERAGMINRILEKKEVKE